VGLYAFHGVSTIPPRPFVVEKRPPVATMMGPGFEKFATLIGFCLAMGPPDPHPRGATPARADEACWLLSASVARSPGIRRRTRLDDRSRIRSDRTRCGTAGGADTALP
jgi:hypothetical protein